MEEQSSPQVDLDAILARLQRVEDELEIRRLLIEYSARLDGKDIDAWIDVFAKNGTWQNGDLVYTGPEQLRELLHKEFGGEPPINYNQTMTYQVIHGPQIEVDGDRAKVRSRHTLFRRDETGHPQSVLAGIYEDELIREDGKWKFLHRNDNPVMPTREEWRAEQAARRAKGL